MKIGSEELARWARFADGARNQMLLLGRHLAHGQTSEASRLLTEMHLSAAWTLAAMELLGAEIPPYRIAAPDVPRALLTSEANRYNCRKLSEAREAAVEVVNKESGWHPDGAADVLADRLARVEREVYGPRSTGRRIVRLPGKQGAGVREKRPAR